MRKIEREERRRYIREGKRRERKRKGRGKEEMAEKGRGRGERVVRREIKKRQKLIATIHLTNPSG